MTTELERGSTVVLDTVVAGEVFQNAVYEGAMSNPKIYIISCRIRFLKPDQVSKKIVTIAEIELLDWRKALDALWPSRIYPYSQRLAVITDKEGPDEVFLRRKGLPCATNLIHSSHKLELHPSTLLYFFLLRATGWNPVRESSPPCARHGTALSPNFHRSGEVDCHAFTSECCL